MRKLTRKGKRNRGYEHEEIELLNSWIAAQKPESGSNPLALPPIPSDAKVGRVGNAAAASLSSFSRYSGATSFDQLPISQKTKDGLRQSNYFKMTEIQRAALPHALCGRDIRGASKTGSGKTLAFVIPVLEKLYRERYTPEFGVGCIILSPTRELAFQIFKVIKSVGRHHGFSAGLLIGGGKDVASEKAYVNGRNILVCTPGRLLQHMDETTGFDCSDLQVLVLDEADRLLDSGFKTELNAIITQLPKERQTFLFSATQTKSVRDLERVSLNNAEYISVDEESSSATPKNLRQTALIVPLDEKMDMLWSFIKSHRNSRTLVFLTTRQQVKFVYEAFKKLRPGVPLKCLHGKMKQERRMHLYNEFCVSKHAVLFCTDVCSRGLDFETKVDWVVQVDCPEDVKAYIHRVGRTARYISHGRSVLFLMPSEMEMLKKLEAQKIALRTQASKMRLQPVSRELARTLVEYPDLQCKARRAFATYINSVRKNRDKEIFDVSKLPIDQFSVSLGLPVTPNLPFLKRQINANKASKISHALEPDSSSDDEDVFKLVEGHDIDDLEEDGPERNSADITPATRGSKKKKLKISKDKPFGTRTVFDDQDNQLPPHAMLCDPTYVQHHGSVDEDKKQEFYRKMGGQLKQEDKEDKLVAQDRLGEKRIKEKIKRKRDKRFFFDVREEDDLPENKAHLDKRSKKFDVSEEENTNNAGIGGEKKLIADLEDIALKWISSKYQS